MKLRTEIPFPHYGFALEHRAGVLTLGSCFADAVGSYLSERKCNVSVNPFGTVFNVSSLAHAVRTAVRKELPKAERIVYRDGLFFHLDYHSSVYGATEDALEERISALGAEFVAFLQNTELLVITLGTSWVYQYAGETVSNCQKLPASEFTKVLLPLEEQVAALESMLMVLREIRPQLKIVMTVSPVRHVKDGLSENGISKALLRVLCQDAAMRYSELYYFPAFEAMVDDLRDYRFYESDLIHPNEVAERYICDGFMRSVYSEEARSLAEQWMKLQRTLRHRPLHTGKGQQRLLLEKVQHQVRAFQGFFNVEEELKEVAARLAELDAG